MASVLALTEGTWWGGQKTLRAAYMESACCCSMVSHRKILKPAPSEAAQGVHAYSTTVQSSSHHLMDLM